jgi:hypothetical protein
VPKAFARSDLEQPVPREFCETCGTHIATRRPGLNAVVLKVGTLDDPRLFGVPQMAIDAVDRQPFHIISEGLPIYDGLPNGLMRGHRDWIIVLSQIVCDPRAATDYGRPKSGDLIYYRDDYRTAAAAKNYLNRSNRCESRGASPLDRTIVRYRG